MKRRNDDDMPSTAEDLRPELSRRRDVADAYRGDELDRKRAEARHGRDLADVAEQARRAELDRAEREATARADADLARMYREARAAGERTRVTSQMARSGEARALRLERLRALNLKVLVPVLLGFAAWSTTGVHDGAARLMQITSSTSAMWWALWLLEPVLIGAVVWVIIARARLAASGGRLADRAVQLAAGCLSVSIALNLAAGAHAPGRWTVAAVLALAAAMLAHAIGPVGAAATAHLIGIVDESIAEADPWTEDGKPVPLLADLDLTLTTATDTAETVAPGPDLLVTKTEMQAAMLANLVDTEKTGEGVFTKAEMQAAILADLIAATTDAETPGPELFSDEALAAWLDGGEPPIQGLMSPMPTPDTDGPHSAAHDVPADAETDTTRPDHTDTDQQQGGDGSGTAPGIASATEARRARGEQTRQRIAEHMTAHPDHTVEQIAEALGVSSATVKRHRRAIRGEQ